MNLKHFLTIFLVFSIALSAAHADPNCWGHNNCADCLAEDPVCVWHDLGSGQGFVCDGEESGCSVYEEFGGCSEGLDCYDNSTGCGTSYCGGTECVADESCGATCGGDGYSNDGGSTCYSDELCIILCEGEPPAPECVATPSCDATCGGTGYSNDEGSTCYSDELCIILCEGGEPEEYPQANIFSVPGDPVLTTDEYEITVEFPVMPKANFKFFIKLPDFSLPPETLYFDIGGGERMEVTFVENVDFGGYVADLTPILTEVELHNGDDYLGGEAFLDFSITSGWTEPGTFEVNVLGVDTSTTTIKTTNGGFVDFVYNTNDCNSKTSGTSACTYYSEGDCNGRYYFDDEDSTYRRCVWGGDIHGCVPVSNAHCLGSIIDAQDGLAFLLSDETDCTDTFIEGTKEVRVWSNSLEIPVGLISYDFSSNHGALLDLPEITILASTEDGKALFEPAKVNFAEGTTKYLLIPKTTGNPYICDDSLISLDDITPECLGYDGSPSYSEVTIDGSDYYKIETTNSGGGNGGGGDTVPEFSDLGWILAAVLGAGGFFIASRKMKRF